MNKQNILCLPNLRKKQSENNQLSKAIEDTRQVSQNLVENGGKIGSSLNTTDVLFPLKKEQELFIPRLSELYGIDFEIKSLPIPNIIGNTSLKSIILDKKGKKYFLKQKPTYSVDNQELAYRFQNYLANETNFVPPILKTINGDDYVKILDKYYFITPYIEGNFYEGKIEQSIASSRALGIVHEKSIKLANSNLKPGSTSNDLRKNMNLLLEKHNSRALTELLDKIKEKIKMYSYNDSQDEKLILHKDFAPYNVVFNYQNDVIGVNDFDNAYFGSSLEDIADVLLTHSAINYAGTTSHMREPISNFFDRDRVEKMLIEYLSNRKNFNIELLDKLPHNVVLVWLEIIVVGLLRGDFSIKSVGENLHFCDKLFKQTREIVEQLKFTDKWKNLLRSSFPEYKNNIDEYFGNEKMGFNHSWQVYNTSLNLKTKFRDSLIDTSIIEFISIFHDIGKFFQKLHSAENINIAIDIFKKFAEKNNLNSEILHKTLDGIKNSDFYNYRLDPLQNPPIFIEGKIVRCADKMQNNLVEKVDRYWFDYGVPRGAVFYDENISLEERGKFNFNNFLGDQLNVILSIIGLRPEDFYDEILNNEYTKWSKPEKERVVNRILSLTEELGYSKNEIKNIKEIIDWYRNKFSC